MASTIERYDFQNVTYETALEFARIWTDACSEDLLRVAFRPEDSEFTAERLPHIADYEQLIARAEQFRRLTESDARRFYLRLRSHPRMQLFLLKDPRGKYVAGAQWIMPKYLPRAHLPLLHRIKTWFLARWYAVREWWDMRGHVNFTQLPALLAEFKWAKLETGASETPERIQELKTSSPKLLRETAYPKDHAYYLALLGARRDAHGGGYGRRLVTESLRALGPYVSPPDVLGPPKATLMSAPTARGFYQRLGFSLAAIVEHELPNGAWHPQTYYFMNLEAGTGHKKD